MSDADFLLDLKEKLKAHRDMSSHLMSLIDVHLRKTNQFDLFAVESELTVDSKLNDMTEGTFTYQRNYNISIPPKTDRIQWKDYFYMVIKEMRGKVKTGDIANVIIKVNKDLTYNRVRQEAATKLPLLVKENKIKVTPGATKKSGNTYEVLS